MRTQAVRNLIQLEAREAEPLLWDRFFQNVIFGYGKSVGACAFGRSRGAFYFAGWTVAFRRLLLDPDVLLKSAVLGRRIPRASKSIALMFPSRFAAKIGWPA